MGLNLTRKYSINFSIPKRSKKTIKFIIIHYTGMRSQAKAIKRLCELNSKVSAHYFIKNDGEILNLVPDLYEAWHAGESNWKNFKSLNKYSIGIEINNPGHNNGYIKFKSKQMSALRKLLKELTKKYKIKRFNVLGHSDIAPDRKKDPGEKFPWKKLASLNLSIWHSLSENKTKKKRNVNIDNFAEKTFLKNLYRIGYPKIDKAKYKSSRINLIKTFQRRFRQSLINGIIDQECVLISENLKKL